MAKPQDTLRLYPDKDSIFLSLGFNDSVLCQMNSDTIVNRVIWDGGFMDFSYNSRIPRNYEIDQIKLVFNGIELQTVIDKRFECIRVFYNHYNGFDIEYTNHNIPCLPDEYK